MARLPWAAAAHDCVGDYTLAFGIAIVVSLLSALVDLAGLAAQVRAVAGRLQKLQAAK